MKNSKTLQMYKKAMLDGSLDVSFKELNWATKAVQHIPVWWDGENNHADANLYDSFSEGLLQGYIAGYKAAMKVRLK